MDLITGKLHTCRSKLTLKTEQLVRQKREAAKQNGTLTQLARSLSYLQRVCCFVLLRDRRPTPDGDGACLRALPACSAAENAAVPLKKGAFFTLSLPLSVWSWARDVRHETDWLSIMCARTCSEGATVPWGGWALRLQPRPLFGLRADFKCDSWSWNPAGFGRLSPGQPSCCPSKGLFHILFHFPKGFELVSDLFWIFKIDFVFVIRWKLCLLSAVVTETCVSSREDLFFPYAMTEFFIASPHFFFSVTWSILSFCFGFGDFPTATMEIKRLISAFWQKKNATFITLHFFCPY